MEAALVVYGKQAMTVKGMLIGDARNGERALKVSKQEPLICPGQSLKTEGQLVRITVKNLIIGIQFYCGGERNMRPDNWKMRQEVINELHT
jgi:hypothetical protein